ncbi:PSD1 and planctomycete cytochrome C domain-containing protein [Rubripirellula amarantea]|nr:PSD1 and planctomycete cytochrome C domain-containing protein [Rubripirellula amarantea]
MTYSTLGIGGENAPSTGEPTAEQIRFFETSIRPLLSDHCYECHNDETSEGDLRLDSLSGMLTGGKAGPAVVAGKPQSSLIVTAISYRDSELRMPPEGKLSDQQVADLTRWVEMGAPHPDRGKVKVALPRGTVDLAAGRKHWAFQPLNDSTMPRSDESANTLANPIDAFIGDQLDRNELIPLGRADKRTLIRRATFDLIGLPPTPEEIEAFVADESETAFDVVVDRLLNSPHYGERWGRHWLDVARYADSNGLDENAAHGNAWRYRDYVVQSFNEDKPYDQFVVEQLAGDLLDSGDNSELRHQRLIATGYLLLGPKVLAEADERKMEMDIVDEQIDTIGRGLMGMTLGCARCHTHKFDPIEHADYYALAGIFKSTKTMESFKTVARWNEVLIADSDEMARKNEHERIVTEAKQKIDTRIAAAKRELTPTKGETVPEDIEKRFPEATRSELKELRDQLEQLEASAPEMPTAMAVVDGVVADVAIHIRGSHLTLGETVPRRFPRVFAKDAQPLLPSDSSGRLEFARWLIDEDHPLTARVMVNRIWRWHFGKGLVPTVDNFGLRGEPPTHPELLDWLAVQFIQNDWSIKSMHRLIMLSETYRRSSSFDANNAKVDSDNRYYWRCDVRRLEAEAIRDSLLAVSGTLDRTMGGRLLATPNRELVFNHTSTDTSNYDTRRRSIYVPVIRNHLYDMFQLFDYADASVLSGNRNTSTISPQALFLMNSEFMTSVSNSMAERFSGADVDRDQRIARLFNEAFGRSPTETEVQQANDFLAQFQTEGNEVSPKHAWQALCQAIVSSSEFVYVK